MKMVIAGGRDFYGTDTDFELVKKAIKKYKINEIVSGKQKGADNFGELCAAALKIPVQPFPPDWDDLTEPCIIKYRNGKPYNALAGPKRNKQMAEYTDYVFLFPGGRGTMSMRKAANAAGKKIVYNNGWLYDNQTD